MRDISGLSPERVAVLEHLEQCRHIAAEINDLKQMVFLKGLEALARQIRGKPREPKG